MAICGNWINKPSTISIATRNGKTPMITSDDDPPELGFSTEDIAARVRELTAGEGVPVVFDSVGRDTFDASLRCLRPHGTLVSFGSASGKVPPFDLFDLNRLGSLYVTSAAFYWYMRTRPKLLARAAELFDVVLKGAVKVGVQRQYPLAAAADAHRDIESRKNPGISVLVP